MDPAERDPGTRLDEHLALLCRLPAIERTLRASDSVSQLLQRTATIACRECGFTRGLVLSVDPDVLTAAQTGALDDAASDALRRRVLADPIALTTGSAEAEAVRRGEWLAPPDTEDSVVRRALALAHPAFGLIAPDDRVLALLVVDRDQPPVDRLDQAAVTALAATAAIALGQVLTRARVQELSAELRHLTAFTQALTTELLDAPMTLPSERAHGGTTFPRVDAVGPAARGAVMDLLNPRERQIAELLVEGRSNREIAAELMLSPETVKDYVARVLRKLGAANRVEAVSRLLS